MIRLHDRSERAQNLGITGIASAMVLTAAFLTAAFLTAACLPESEVPSAPVETTTTLPPAEIGTALVIERCVP